MRNGVCVISHNLYYVKPRPKFDLFTALVVISLRKMIVRFARTISAYLTGCCPTEFRARSTESMLMPRTRGNERRSLAVLA